MNQDGMQPEDNLQAINPLKPTLLKIVLASLALVVLTVPAYYFLIYQKQHLKFQYLTTLDYNLQSVIKIIQTQTPIAFTRNEDLLIGNTSGQEILLVGADKKITSKIANIKIAKSKKYVTWDSSHGLIKLDINSKKAYLIHAGGPRQSYDLSPTSDVISYLTKTSLLQVDLGSGFVKENLNLPNLKNPKIYFNHIKYAPNGELAYIRSIHEYEKDQIKTAGPEDAILNLPDNSLNFLDQSYSIPVNLAPVWSNDSSGLILFMNKLTFYKIKEKSRNSVIGLDIPQHMRPYALNPSNSSIAFITFNDSDKKSGNIYNPEVAFYIPQTQELKELISSNDPKLAEYRGNNGSAKIWDLGWLDDKRLWLDYRYTKFASNLLSFNVQTGEIRPIIQNIDLYSLDSVVLPITEAYTLYNR